MKAISEIFLQQKKPSPVLDRQEKNRSHDFKFIWSLCTCGQWDKVCTSICLEADLTICRKPGAHERLCHWGSLKPKQTWWWACYWHSKETHTEGTLESSCSFQREHGLQCCLRKPLGEIIAKLRKFYGEICQTVHVPCSWGYLEQRSKSHDPFPSIYLLAIDLLYSESVSFSKI